MHKDYKDLGIEKRLIELRIKAGLTQKEVADMLYISEKKYIRIESGEAELMSNHLYKLCHLYKCSSDYILFGE